MGFRWLASSNKLLRGGILVAKKSWIAKQQRTPKFTARAYNRCQLCGRRHAYMRKFGICRICFRENALAGNIPGIRKASW